MTTERLPPLKALETTRLLIEHMSKTGSAAYRNAPSLFKVEMLCEMLAYCDVHVQKAVRTWNNADSPGSKGSAGNVFAVVADGVHIGPNGEIEWYEIARSAFAFSPLKPQTPDRGYWSEELVFYRAVPEFMEADEPSRKNFIDAVEQGKSWLAARLINETTPQTHRTKPSPRL